MTRPMPGPPEPVPHEFDTLPHKLTDDPWVYCSGCAAENRIRLADPKRLKDAECAAEYWRSMFDAEYETPHGYERQIDIVRTWHRFATRPHALESDGAAS